MGIAFFFMLRNWLGAVNNLSDYQVRCILWGTCFYIDHLPQQQHVAL